MNPRISAVFLSLVLLVALMVTTFGCKAASPKGGAADLKGLTASATAANKAVLLSMGAGWGKNGYEKDPEHVKFFHQDLVNIQAVLQRPELGFGVEIVKTQKDTENAQLVSAITEAAAATGPDGTFILLLGGHGSPKSPGTTAAIQVNDQNYTVLTAERLLEIMYAARKAGPLRRFVLMLASCHSGFFIERFRELGINHEILKEVIVLASSQTEVTSFFGDSGSSFTVGVTRAIEELIPRRELKPTIRDLVKLATHHSQIQDQRYLRMYNDQETVRTPRRIQAAGFPSDDLLNEELINAPGYRGASSYQLGIVVDRNVLTADQGVVVANFDGNSAARAAGIMIGDRIVAIDGQPVANVDDYNRLTAHLTKDTLALTYARPVFKDGWTWGKATDLTVRLRTTGATYTDVATPVRGTYDVGGTIQPSIYTDQWGRQFPGTGVLVSAIEANVKDRLQGDLRPNDFILAINGDRLNSPTDYADLTARLDRGVVDAELYRDGKTIHVGLILVPKS